MSDNEPWTVVEEMDYRSIADSRGAEVAAVHGRTHARLIAAAPDLLSACKDAVTELYEFIDDCIEDPNESDYRIIRLIEAAIAKAESPANDAV